MESSKLNLRQGARRVSKRVTFTLGRLVSLCGSGNWPTAIKSGNWKRNRAGSEPFAAATKPHFLADPARFTPALDPDAPSQNSSLTASLSISLSTKPADDWWTQQRVEHLSPSVQVLRFLSESRSFLMGRDTSNKENVLADDRSLANGPISNQATRYLAIVSNSRDYPRDD